MACVMHHQREQGGEDKRVPWREKPQDMVVIEFIDQIERKEGSGGEHIEDSGHTVT